MNKSEILFYYEVKNCNPNGDPIEADAPRKDGDYILVSDVRLKRTIRDYWNLKDKEKSKTYFLPKEKSNGTLFTRTDLFKEVNGKDAKEKIDNIFNEYIDMRLFGAVFALDKKKRDKDSSEKGEKGNYNFTGAVQFSIGKSKHKASDKQIKGTTVVPSGEGKEQGTFTNRFVVPYALIEFYGVVNPNNYPENLKSDDKLFQNDMNYLCEGMWEGTRNLFTRSKLGHRPALIIKVNYKDDKFIGFIGDYVKLKTKEKESVKVSEKDIRSCEDYSLDISGLGTKIIEANDQKIIDSVDVFSSECFSNELKKLNLQLKEKEIPVNEIAWDEKDGQ